MQTTSWDRACFLPCLLLIAFGLMTGCAARTADESSPKAATEATTGGDPLRPQVGQAVRILEHCPTWYIGDKWGEDPKHYNARIIADMRELSRFDTDTIRAALVLYLRNDAKAGTQEYYHKEIMDTSKMNVLCLFLFRVPHWVYSKRWGKRNRIWPLSFDRKGHLVLNDPDSILNGPLGGDGLQVFDDYRKLYGRRPQKEYGP